MTEESARKVVPVADDDRDITDLVTLRLDRSGYEVIQAFDGQDALDLALVRLPELCVLDVTMSAGSSRRGPPSTVPRRAVYRVADRALVRV